MAAFIDSWIRRLTAPDIPAAVFHVARGSLGGLRRARQSASVKSSVVRSLPAGLVEPSFDKPNLPRPEEFQSAVKDAVRRIGSPEGPVALLLPETSVKTVLLSFDSLPPAPDEREKIIRWRLARTLPLPPAETRLSFAVSRTNGRARAFCVLAAAGVVREYEKAFAAAGLDVRTVGLPTPALLGCLPKNRPANQVIVNIEEDYFAALAILDGGPALFRVKPLSTGNLWEEAAEETAATLRFLEDREKKEIESVWLRPAAGGDAGTGAALIQSRVSRPVRILPGDGSTGIPPADRIRLAPLLGQIS